MSKATKILDLDKFGADAGRTITIAGAEYAVIEMSFSDFVATTSEAQRLQADEKSSIQEHVEASIAMIRRSVPTLAEETLREMSLTKLGVIVQFLGGELDAELDKAATEAAQADAAGTSKGAKVTKK